MEQEAQNQISTEAYRRIMKYTRKTTRYYQGVDIERGNRVVWSCSHKHENRLEAYQCAVEHLEEMAR